MKLTEDKGVKVFKKERTWSGGTFYVYSLGVASKDKNGNWTNGYLECQFKKSDEEKITNKCKIKINNAFPTVTQSNGKSFVKWFINDFEVVEAGEIETAVDPNEFMQIDDAIGDEVPFL